VVVELQSFGTNSNVRICVCVNMHICLLFDGCLLPKHVRKMRICGMRIFGTLLHFLHNLEKVRISHILAFSAVKYSL